MSEFIYDKINNLILAQLEKGTIPWQRPWHKSTVTPQNFVSKHEYTGCNFFLTSILGGTKPYFMTIKQVNDLGGSVKAGSKAIPIIYWNIKQKEEGSDEKSYAFLKYSNVFRADDINGIEFPEAKELPTIDFKPILEAEKIIEQARAANKIAEFSHNESSAYYMPSSDKISMPKKEHFKSEEEYYSTFFHEAGHSTGHESRLKRKTLIELNRFGSHDYSKEELVAELTSAYLCATSKIENTLENSSAYIEGWSKKLKENKRWFIEASAQAQKAANYILNKAGIEAGLTPERIHQDWLEAHMGIL